jgi:hypothetical protein
MAKDTVHVEIKRIGLDVKLKGVSPEEIANLAGAVENEMFILEEDGEIDTLKQAVHAALFFATKAYLQYKDTQAEQQANNARADKIIERLQQSLNALEDSHD